MTRFASLANATYPHFFRRGIEGIESTHAYAKTQIKRSCAYSIALFAGLWVFTPLLPLVLGGKYAQTAVALRWLALLPLLQGVHVSWMIPCRARGFKDYARQSKSESSNECGT